MSLTTPATDANNNGNTTVPTPFHDLDQFLALPCLAGLLLSPDGNRLVTSVVTLNRDATGYCQALWEIDPTGERPARRITRSAAGERAVAFLPGGDLLFLSGRPDPDARPGEHAGPGAALWLLPADGGEARLLATRPGGIQNVAVASCADRLVLASPTLPSAVTDQDDQQARARRAARRVTAVLHDMAPVRYGDRDLGPEEVRLFAGSVPKDEPPPQPVLADPADGSGPSGNARGYMALRDLTPRPGRALHGAGFQLCSDGSTAAVGWQVAEPGRGWRRAIVLVDTRTGERRTLLDDPEATYFNASYSPDGLHVAAIWENRTSPERPTSRRLVVAETCPGGRARIIKDWDRWPACPPVWSPDGRSLFVTADDGGRTPVFRVDLSDGGRPDRVVRLTLDDGAYNDLQAAPDGTVVYALRSAVDAPPVPVRLDAARPGNPEPLSVPAERPALPGTLTEVTAAADDGTPLRGWLVLPDGIGAERPAPLLLWLHGGPHTTWSGWNWRWNPWLMAARGYAVLLPDPGLSTGYGDSFVARGWASWGDAPYTDLMAITDAAEARPDIATGRSAVMGGSFGGYLANWIAGHTGRFVGIVSHAGMWALDQFAPTSDLAHYWARELTPERQLALSPHSFVAAVRTPMLVVHGGRDYRVPVGESLRLWTELLATAREPETLHRFLCFPYEDHSVSAPQHIKVWYEAVFAFLDTTVHGRPWVVPEILR